MKIIFLIFVLMVPTVLLPAVEKPALKKTTGSSAAQKTVDDYDQAAQALGDILIKSGLLSPWLEQMRDDQKALNELDAKNKLGIRAGAVKEVEDDLRACTEREQSKNSPAKNPLERELDALNEQKKSLIAELVAKKEKNISSLIALDDKIKTVTNTYFKSMIADAKESDNAEEKLPMLPEYAALLKKLDALSNVIVAVAMDNMKLKQSIRHLFDSNDQAKKYIAVVAQPMYKRGECAPNITLFRRAAHDVYADLIMTMALFYGFKE